MKLATTDATLALVDGRVAMSADVEGDLYLDTPEHTPLSGGETRATLRVAGEDARAEVELDAEALDALADAVYHAQEGDR